MRFAKVRYYQDKKQEWRWQLRAGNGKVIATGESHSRKADAVRAYERVEFLMAEAKNAEQGLFTAKQMKKGAQHMLNAYLATNGITNPTNGVQ